MEPVGRMDPSDLPQQPPAFDPVALASWLGAPVAMLSEPPGRTHYVEQTTESIGHEVIRPWYATIEHRYDSDDPADPAPPTLVLVRTRLRGDDGATARSVLTEAIRDYQVTSAIRRGVSVAPSRRPAELDEHLRQPLDGWSWRDVVVDRRALQWEYIALDDYATGEEIVGCGGQLGNTLIAVVGPRGLIARLAVVTVAPQQMLPEENPAQS